MDVGVHKGNAGHLSSLIYKALQLPTLVRVARGQYIKNPPLMLMTAPEM